MRRGCQGAAVERQAGRLMTEEQFRKIKIGMAAVFMAELVMEVKSVSVQQ